MWETAVRFEKKSRKESKKSQVKLKVDWIWVQQIWIPRKAQATPGLLWLVRDKNIESPRTSEDDM